MSYIHARPGVHVTIEYRVDWHDGYGARGWKIGPAVGDPRVIASTAHAGPISPTCVLVHDILDHHLCGLSIGGHRNEVIATMLHAMRNDLSVDKSIDMMIDEFMATGQCGEPVSRFLPKDITPLIARNAPDETILKALISVLGQEGFRQRLIRHYYAIGLHGLSRALARYEETGLSICQRPALGRALQKVIEWAEEHVCGKDLAMALGFIEITNKGCELILDKRRWSREVENHSSLRGRLAKSSARHRRQPSAQ